MYKIDNFAVLFGGLVFACFAAIMFAFMVWLGVPAKIAGLIIAVVLALVVRFVVKHKPGFFYTE